MVSLRCKLVVKNELEKMGLKPINIGMGKVIILDEITAEQRDKLKGNLQKSGLGLLDENIAKLIEQLRAAVIELVYYTDELPENYSNYITEKMAFDYNQLSDMIAEMRGISIQQYITFYKIELVKDLLVYDGLTLSEIAAKTKYTSVAQLYRQFKKLTGLSPSFFKALKKKRNENIKKE